MHIGSLLARFSVRLTARVLPDAAVRAVFRHATDGYGLALCVHRVGKKRRRKSPASEMTIGPEKLDELLALVDDPRREGPFWMTVDDGYADALAYVEARAPQHPRIKWLFFVCPEKLTARAGFRWDHYELLRRAKKKVPPFTSFMGQALDIAAENERPALREIAKMPEFELATVDACRRIARLPNVALGGHTNAHFNLCLLSDRDAARELDRSTASFERTFGCRMDHFSFPFGSPGKHFSERHVDHLRAIRNPIMWSTRGLTYAVREQRPGSVLPRFTFSGAWSGKAMALWMSLQAARARLATTGRASDRRERARPLVAVAGAKTIERAEIAAAIVAGGHVDLRWSRTLRSHHSPNLSAVA